tara:strand:+ start:2413 stop:2568 length:156 start_codon:yes stop_codon:yes gene_type:complete
MMMVSSSSSLCFLYPENVYEGKKKGVGQKNFRDKISLHKNNFSQKEDDDSL